MDITTEERIVSSIRTRQWNALSEEDWVVVLKSILREDIENLASFRGQTIDPLIETFPNLCIVSYCLVLDSRDGEIVAVVSTLEDLERRKDKSWTRMRKGFSLLIDEMVKSNYPGRDEAIREVLNFGLMVEGSLQRKDLTALLDTQPSKELKEVVLRILSQVPE